MNAGRAEMVTTLSKRGAALLEVRRFPIAMLLAALVLFIVAVPFLEELTEADWVEPLLLTIVLVAALLAVGTRPRTLATLAILIVPAVLGRWVHHFHPRLMQPAVYRVAGTLFVALVVVLLLRFILSVPRVSSEVLCVGVVIFLLLGLLWALAYLVVAGIDPNSFKFNSDPAVVTLNSSDALYFSFGTLSTVGFGDIVPSSRMARMLAVMEATTGMIYLAIVIARLVSLYSAKEPGGST